MSYQFHTKDVDDLVIYWFIILDIFYCPKLVSLNTTLVLR